MTVLIVLAMAVTAGSAMPAAGARGGGGDIVPWRVRLALVSGSGYQISVRETGEGRESAWLWPRARTASMLTDAVLVTVFARGTFEPAAFRDATRVPVGRGVGYLLGGGSEADASAWSQRVLAWELRPGVWATARPLVKLQDGTARTKLIGAAAAIRLGPPRPVPVPLRLVGPPERLRLLGVIASTGRDDGLSGSQLAEATFGRGAVSEVRISVSRKAPGIHYLPFGRIRVAGRPARFTSGRLSVDFGPAVVHVAAAAGTPTLAELAAIASAVELAATPDDVATWFEAAEATTPAR